MSDFEQDLANVVGAFMEINLDCVEKQNQEIEQLQQEKRQLKEIIGEVRKCIDNIIFFKDDDDFFEMSFKELHEEEYKEIVQILDKVGD